MKKINKIMMVAILGAIHWPVVAADIPIESSRLDLTGSDVNLNFRITSGAQPDIKILFCECGTTRGGVFNPNGGFTENAILQPWGEWYNSTSVGQTTTKQMLIDGWKIQSIVPRGTGVLDQFYIIFTK